MKTLFFALLFLTLNSFAQTNTHHQSCPAMHGYINIDKSGDIEFFSWNGVFAFSILDYELTDTKEDVKGTSYFVNFDQNFKTQLYDAINCNVKGHLKVKDISSRDVMLPQAQ